MSRISGITAFQTKKSNLEHGLLKETGKMSYKAGPAGSLPKF